MQPRYCHVDRLSGGAREYLTARSMQPQLSSLYSCAPHGGIDPFSQMHKLILPMTRVDMTEAIITFRHLPPDRNIFTKPLTKLGNKGLYRSSFSSPSPCASAAKDSRRQEEARAASVTDYIRHTQRKAS